MDSLDLLWASVNLLFALLGSTSQTQDKVKGGLLLDVVITDPEGFLPYLES